MGFSQSAAPEQSPGQGTGSLATLAFGGEWDLLGHVGIQVANKPQSIIKEWLREREREVTLGLKKNWPIYLAFCSIKVLGDSFFDFSFKGPTSQLANALACMCVHTHIYTHRHEWRWSLCCDHNLLLASIRDKQRREWLKRRLASTTIWIWQVSSTRHPNAQEQMTNW